MKDIKDYSLRNAVKEIVADKYEDGLYILFLPLDTTDVITRGGAQLVKVDPVNLDKYLDAEGPDSFGLYEYKPTDKLIQESDGISYQDRVFMSFYNGSETKLSKFNW